MKPFTKCPICGGEIVEKEAEKHIRKKLGLPTEEAKAK